MVAKTRPVLPCAPTAEPRRGRGRPPSIDQQKLLDVARDVFLEKGIRATTLEVAERAGVSEGAIFHRFKTKDALFREAMGFDVANIPGLLTDALAAIEGMDLREGLIQLATAMLEIGREGIPIMMMSWSNPDMCGQFHTDARRQAFELMIKKFATYFEQKMDMGLIRRMDGEILMRIFWGSLHHYRFTRVVAGDSGSPMIPEGMFVRGLVDLIVSNQAAVPPALGSNRRLSRF